MADETLKEVGESSFIKDLTKDKPALSGALGGATAGGSIGAALGLLGGPFAPITSTVGGSVGAVIGASIGFVGGLIKKNTPKPGNNQEFRNILDKISVPADFDTRRYGELNPDVAHWAGNCGLNDDGYVQIAMYQHYLLHGKAEGRIYPKKGLEQAQNNTKIKAWNDYVNSQKITNGTFDWVGGQNEGVNTGFHANGVVNLKAGDTVEISGTNGAYDGQHVIQYIGDDSGGYTLDMFTLPIKRTIQTAGYWRKVDNTGKTVAMVAGGALGTALLAWGANWLVKKVLG